MGFSAAKSQNWSLHLHLSSAMICLLDATEHLVAMWNLIRGLNCFEHVYLVTSDH